MEILREWFRRYFSDPQVVILALLLVAGFAVVLTMGDMLAPVLAAVVIAYLLEGVAGFLERCGASRISAVLLVFSLFMAVLLFVMFGLLPLLSTQLAQLVKELPAMLNEGREALMRLPERYPNYIAEEQVEQLISGFRGELVAVGQKAVSYSLASVKSLITLMVYLILVPLLVFFFLKDKQMLLDWAAGLLPKQRALAVEVWREVNLKFVGYVRGKILEILVVWAASYASFAAFGLNYGLLLGVLVGLSVVIPYVGAAVVTVPVVFVAYIQWGFTSDFVYVVSAYAIIQFLDGNLLVPLLFSEMVNLHPVAIMTAVLLFGGLWGVWGVFFAIPLATLVQAVAHALKRATAPPELIP